MRHESRSGNRRGHVPAPLSNVSWNDLWRNRNRNLSGDLIMFMNRPDLAITQGHFESACHCSRAWQDLRESALTQYGDGNGKEISGSVREHFPTETRDHLRRVAQSVSYHSDLAHKARPKRVRVATIIRLGREVATRDGSGFYGPQSLI